MIIVSAVHDVMDDNLISASQLFWGNILYTIGVYFLGGLIIGSVLSVIYNLLLHKRFDLFGLDHCVD